MCYKFKDYTIHRIHVIPANTLSEPISSPDNIELMVLDIIKSQVQRQMPNLKKLIIQRFIQSYIKFNHIPKLYVLRYDDPNPTRVNIVSLRFNQMVDIAEALQTPLGSS